MFIGLSRRFPKTTKSPSMLPLCVNFQCSARCTCDICLVILPKSYQLQSKTSHKHQPRIAQQDFWNAFSALIASFSPPIPSQIICRCCRQFLNWSSADLWVMAWDIVGNLLYFCCSIVAPYSPFISTTSQSFKFAGNLNSNFCLTVALDFYFALDFS